MSTIFSSCERACVEQNERIFNTAINKEKNSEKRRRLFSNDHFFLTQITEEPLTAVSVK